MRNNAGKYPGAFLQIRIYVGKFCRLFINEKQWLTLIMSTLIAWLVSKVVGSNLFVTMESTKTGCLALACVCLWNGMFNSVQVVCKERAIIKREHRSGLKIISYLGAHMIVQALISALQALIILIMLKVCGVVYPAQGLVCPIFAVDFFITLFLITFASDMMGLLVSCIARTTTIAMTVMPFVLIVQLVFAGVAFPLGPTASKLSDLTISKWGVTALCTEANYNDLDSYILYNQMKNMANSNEMLADIMKKVEKKDVGKFSAQYAQNESYAYTEENVSKVWSILLLFSAAFAALSVFFLSFVDHDKR